MTGCVLRHHALGAAALVALWMTAACQPSAGSKIGTLAVRASDRPGGGHEMRLVSLTNPSGGN